MIGKCPKRNLNCSNNTNVIIVCGPKRTNAGVKPLKKTRGNPWRAVNMMRCTGPLNSPGLAFIALVLRTSRGCVMAVAIAPCKNMRII